jgi:2,4-dienoyl-CoA reductase-like NADH-dependent reductase (Old Yellow Enzyme family)
MTTSLTELDSVAQASQRNLDELVMRFERGDFDMVAVGRAMIAEPDWPLFVRNGEFDRLKPFSIKALQEATAIK